MSLKSGSEKSKNKNNTSENKQPVNKTLLNKINQILELVLTENKNLKNYKQKLLSQKNMSFSASYIPPISVKQYLSRIFNYSEAEESTLIIALIYIDRLNCISSVILTPYNIHRILFIAILLAIKYNEDNTYDFEYYSQVAGISVKELKVLEFEFVCLLKFKLFINKKEFDEYKLYIDDIDCEDDNVK